MTNLELVQQEAQTIFDTLGDQFTLRNIRVFIEQRRNKSLLIEPDVMPVKITGYCIFLLDVDLICTRKGLDDVLEVGACAHEMSHILLHEHLVPKSPVKYQEFIKNRNSYLTLHREYGTAYQTPQEREAELLGRYIASAILRAKYQSSDLTRKMFGSR